MIINIVMRNAKILSSSTLIEDILLHMTDKALYTQPLYLSVSNGYNYMYFEYKSNVNKQATIKVNKAKYTSDLIRNENVVLLLQDSHGSTGHTTTNC